MIYTDSLDYYLVCLVNMSAHPMFQKCSSVEQEASVNITASRVRVAHAMLVLKTGLHIKIRAKWADTRCGARVRGPRLSKMDGDG